MAEPLRAVPATPAPTRASSSRRRQEDLVVGDELVRFRYYTRVVHWGVALTFFVCLFTGLPIWTPIFGWLAPLFGGLQVCRWLHPWTGIAFAVFALLQFVHWAGDMQMTAADKRFELRTSSPTCAGRRTTRRSASSTAARRSCSG